MNILDRAINYVSPGWAVQRARSRMMASIINETAYRGASYLNRSLKRFLPRSGSANSDYSQSEQGTLRARCRDAHRNQPLARAAVERKKHNVVGTGLRLQSRIDNEYLDIPKEEASKKQRIIEREFALWSKHCDIERSLSFEGIQVLSLVSWLTSGDVFVNTPFVSRRDSDFGLKLQVIESDRVSNPGNGMDTKNRKRGVELGKGGDPIAYWIQSEHPGDNVNIEWKWKRFPAFGALTGRRRILHIWEKERPGQARGVPMLAPVLEPLKKMDQYSEAELTAAVISSLLTVFIKSPSPQFGFPPPSTESTNDPKEDDQIALGSGAILSLDQGEDIVSVNPMRPNSVYDPFVTAVFKQIGAALGLPLEFLMLSFMASYSAARAALLQAWKVITYDRGILIEKLCQPVYELWFDEMVLLGKIDAPGYFEEPMVRFAWTKAAWVGPARGAIDENREVQASEDKIRIGLSNIQREAEKHEGEDWLDIHRQRAIEKKMREDDGLEESQRRESKNLPSAEQTDVLESIGI